MPFSHKLKIAYLSGPVDAESVYSAWLKKRHQSYFGTSYLSQFYEVCTEIGAEGYVITTLPDTYKYAHIDNFIIENRPPPTSLRSLSYHAAMCYWYLRLLWRLVHYKPDILIATAFPNYWFLLSPLRWLNVSIVASIHCTLWPKFAPQSLPRRLLLQADRLLFFNHTKAIMTVSEDIMKQVRGLLNGREILLSVCTPTYDRNQFASLSPSDCLKTPPFRIMFAGRIEINKGVFDLLTVAKRLQQNGRNDIVFDVCGEGSKLDSLYNQVKEQHLENSFFCHGFCDAQKYRIILENAYAVVVPTTTEFEEGFNKVCAEGILAGRPVITSAVCPALATIRNAAIEVAPDSIDEYYDAIVELCDNQNLYKEKCEACIDLQQQFYDVTNSWGSHFRQILLQVFSRLQ